MDVLTADQYNPLTLGFLFEYSDLMQDLDYEKQNRRDLATRHIGRQVCSLFYEPSTRTRFSFEQAATKLGIGVVGTENAGEFSSAIKGETLEDTIKIANAYNFDAIVIRHPEVGSAKRAAEVSDIPILNAGDGKGEHPTQALLDTYTIWRKKHKLNDLNVVIGGDLKFGRTVRSLVKLLSLYENNSFTFVSAPEFNITKDIKKELKEKNIEFRRTDDVSGSFNDADVVYWTRTQNERIDNATKKQIESAQSIKINKKILNEIPSSAIIMHPMPINDEFTKEVYKDDRSIFYEQAANGLYIRMALLDDIMKQI